MAIRPLPLPEPIAPPVPALPSRRDRLRVALLVALVGGAIIAHVYASMLPGQSPDFTQHWLVIRGVLHGVQPTETLDAAGWRYHGYYYPLPSAVLTMPLAWMSLYWAQVTFVALSLGMLTYGLTARGWWPLLWLVSGPVLMVAAAGQWAGLLTAAVALPTFRWLWVGKPNVGLALAAGWGVSRAAVIGGVLATAIAFALDPQWVQDFRAALPFAHHVVAPFRRPWGWLLFLALLKWRRPEARYLAAYALIPQSTTLNDMTPLVLCAGGRRELMVLTFLTQVALLIGGDPVPGQAAAGITKFWPIAFAFGYLPALVMVLRKPNVGEPWTVPWRR